MLRIRLTAAEVRKINTNYLSEEPKSKGIVRAPGKQKKTDSQRKSTNEYIVGEGFQFYCYMCQSNSKNTRHGTKGGMLGIHEGFWLPLFPVGPQAHKLGMRNFPLKGCNDSITVLVNHEFKTGLKDPLAFVCSTCHQRLFCFFCFLGTHNVSI